MNLFCFAMLLLVLGDNFLVMFTGWEGVGLCSYLLIGFWYTSYRKASAGMKAFVVNRVGDFGFVGGMMMLFWALGGAWTGEGYLSDGNPRLAAVAVEHEAHGGHAKAQGPAEEATLTLTAFPGAEVIVDDRVIGRSPIVGRKIRPGAHEVTVRVSRREEHELRFDARGPVHLALIGPTVRFREVRDQMAIRNGAGKQFLRENLGEKTLWGVGLVTLACLCFFLGAAGKSAQIPLFTWLPDAMAGPTPVSALIHAATMVTAGVYMVARLNFLFSMSAVAMTVVACVGAATALFAATIGFFQFDIKKVLAYSTVSQLGFMFIGVGVGAYWAGVFHLVTHAFFKACLFLAAGAVIHGMHHVLHGEAETQDMRNMGGLGKVMPWTRRTYFISCLAITAAPVPGLAGFWSKDEILFKALTAQNLLIPGVVIWAMAAIAAGCTSFYMWRSYFLTFEGEPRAEIKEKIHDDGPKAMWMVLAILAGLAVVGGGLGFVPAAFGGHPMLEVFLEPVMDLAEVRFAHWSHGAERGMMLASVAIALGGWYLARTKYAADPAKGYAWEKTLPAYQLVLDKYRIDELYRATFVEAFLRLRMILARFDQWVIDATVDATAVALHIVVWMTGKVDHHVVDGAVNGVASGAQQAGRSLRRIQTGQIQHYVYGILTGVFVLAIVKYIF